ncbi:MULTISPECIES: SAM-dependent methyltransferase [unclassified Streptomyces]|uniref:SAM-dependent methyltransferase n=1 Tax=unclassified Streptomyces TaxID=2593676 RepID=UPI001F0409A8|nr:MULTISPECIES: SAM-dependent methyltransferase [unclassified Streptomyces]MCH0564875.1 SAM-dependent methyltransferase [Streptomyces sp. MUM 2J]MCH0569851.1 SAM-dependent methyltransferase [Streptomyces sp. MUM 136J]
MTLKIEPVGTVVGGHQQLGDTYWGGVESVIRLNPGFPAEAVRGLDEFSHLVVTWHFSLASASDVILGARGPRDGQRRHPSGAGTFAHRDHRRPNQLATSFPRLLRIDGLDLHVTDLDAIDGTPVYDLGPYFTVTGPQGVVREPAWPAETLRDYWALWTV